MARLGIILRQSLADLQGRGPDNGIFVGIVVGIALEYFDTNHAFLHPVEQGLVASVNRPGSNVTGASFFTASLGPKRLELLREVALKPTTIALLVNPNSPTAEPLIRGAEEAVR